MREEAMKVQKLNKNVYDHYTQYPEKFSNSVKETFCEGLSIGRLIKWINTLILMGASQLYSQEGQKNQKVKSARWFVHAFYREWKTEKR